jgi:hypothetical protein
VCDELTAADIQSFFDRWMAYLPLPMTTANRATGFDYRLSILQMEVSHSQVFDDPQRGREFFEEVIRDNFDLGRPDCSCAISQGIHRLMRAPTISVLSLIHRSGCGALLSLRLPGGGDLQ